MAQWHQNYHFVKDVINIIIMSRPSSTVIINKNSHVFFFIQRQRKYLSHFFLSRDDPKNCFCHSSACTTTRWECHEVNKLANLSSVSVSWQIKKVRNMINTAGTSAFVRWDLFRTPTFWSWLSLSFQSSECSAMEKCKGKECSCQDNTCA